MAHRSPIGRARRVLLALAVLQASTLGGLAEPPTASADCGRERPSRDIRDYRTLAFSGRVAALTPPDGPGTDWTISVDVDDVLAGAVSDPFVVYDSGGDCGMVAPERLRVGQQVLMSVGAVDAATPGRVGPVLLWRRASNGWRFAGRTLWGGDDRSAYPPEARVATTREAILGLVGGPAIPPIPAGPEVAPADDVAWASVEGVLGGAVRGLHVELEAPVAWEGRFWALERAAVASSSDDERIAWHEPAVWLSADGGSWQRTPLPQGLRGDLSLMPWGERLVVIEQRYLDERPGIDARVWTSSDGATWRRVGGLRLHPRGRYRGCGFTRTRVAATPRTLVVTASCLPMRGSGGWVRPGLATVGAAQRTRRPTYTTYSWTTTDGRRWTPHRLFAPADESHAQRIVQLEPAGTGLAAVVDRSWGSRQDLLWSPDGAWFTTVAPMPVMGTDIVVDDVHGIALVPRDDGRLDWLLLLAHSQQGADRQPSPGTGINLWRLDPEGAWTVAHPLGTEASSGSLATQGARVAVVVTEAVAESDGMSRRSTALSTDGGHTFVESNGPTDLDYECQPRSTMVGDGGVTTCYEPGGALTRHATLWKEVPE